MTISQQCEIIERGVVHIHSREELISKLERAAREKRPLRIKLGVDPTTSDIHLGHTVVLRKLRQFQDLGHQAVLIIGDFTALIGDPSGRDETRPQISYEKIRENARTYLEQIGKTILVEKAEIVENGQWFKKMKLEDFLKLASHVTVARILQRDDFSKRYRNNIPICLHEIIYPLMQAYDSVMVRADVELGGTDQLYNLLMGREIQRDFGQEEQVILTMPLLVGTDGSMKMSKSLGNHIGVNDPPNEMFGKCMSIPDSLLETYFTLLTSVSRTEIQKLLSPEVNPRDAKLRLAREIVANYHNKDAAEVAEREFIRVFSRKQMPSEMPEIPVCRGSLKEGKMWIVSLITMAGFAQSNNEARRLVRQGAVSLGDLKVSDETAEIELKDGMILRVGRRKFGRVSMKETSH